MTLVLSLMVIGFIVGLGAVTVIDTLGFLGRTNTYWSETTLRAHHVTKPLIWVGIALYGLGLGLAPSAHLPTIPLQALLLGVLIGNGIFLSFVISPRLIARERRGEVATLLPARMQRAIAISFIISVLGWWGSLFLFIQSLTRIIS
jgi:hypothetical protein